MNLAPALLANPMDKNDAPISNHHHTTLQKHKRRLPHLISDHNSIHDIVFSGPNSVSADAFLDLPVAGDLGCL